MNPEVQYVYHCTTHVPYNTACANTNPISIHETPRAKCGRGEKKLTFTTTANTMGPKIMFTFISMAADVAR